VDVADVSADPACQSFRDAAAAAGLRAAWAQPVRAPNGAVLGVLAILRRRAGAPGLPDIARIEANAQMVALAVALYGADETFLRDQHRGEAGTTRQLESFFDLSLDMLCIRDSDYRFVKVNQAWETALGYSIAELEGRPMVDLIHPDDIPTTQARMKRIQREEKIVGYVNRYRRRSGEYRSLEWRARRVGDIVFGVARDVTDRLALEAEMTAARHAAEAANRAKSEFLANMSHEIRTPLNGVLGVVGVLGRTELTVAQREMVDLIQSSGVTLERLVSDILDVSKIEAGRLDIEARVFDLGAELDGLLEMNRLRAEEKGLAFQVTLGPSARGEFLGDSVRIKQVLGNLLSNAVKFTSHGEVRVAMDVVEQESSTLTFAVQDTGVGFDAATAATLFQRFTQADSTITRRFGGTGLGLSISKALVELMGGEIVVQSEPGRGSAFHVAIPLRRHRALAVFDVQEKTAAVRPDEGVEDGLRILLAEDHPTNQKVIQMILAPYGARITTVEDGAQAVAAFEAGAFDLVLMDMQMPVMDGLTAIRAP
jgi:PAS domain S-box-containing protein